MDTDVIVIHNAARMSVNAADVCLPQDMFHYIHSNSSF